MCILQIHQLAIALKEAKRLKNLNGGIVKKREKVNFSSDRQGTILAYLTQIRLL